MSDDNTVKKAAKGLSLMLVVKLLSKFLQLFLNFEVIKKVEPAVFSLSTYFVTMSIFQTTLNKVLLPQVYQKRSGKSDDEKTKISSKNLVRKILREINLIFLKDGDRILFIHCYILRTHVPLQLFIRIQAL